MAERVLQFFSTLNNGGAENRMMDVYRNLDHSVVQFDFAVVNEGQHFFDEEIQEYGAKKYVLPNPRNGLLNNYRAMVHFFKNNPYQAVHAHVSWYSGLVLLAAKQAGIPIRIAHARDAKEQKRKLPKEIACRIGQILISISATQKIAISESAAENIFGKRVAENKEYLFVPNSIDEKKYKVLTSKERENLRSQLGIDEEQLAIVTVANLRAQKNHKFLFEIIQHLKEKISDFQLFLIGDGPLRKELEYLAKTLKIDGDVRFLGIRNDVPEILGAFDLLLFPSLFEGLGGVVLEAQLTGVPSLVSDRIPPEADLGIGFVEYMSLNRTADEWAEASIKRSKNNKWSYSVALDAFKKQGYQIRTTAERYLKEYGIDEETINQAVIN